MKRGFSIGLVAAAIALGGCSQPVLEIDEPSETQLVSAGDVLANTAVKPSRNVHASEMFATVRRVLVPIRESSFEVCTDLSLPPEQCEKVLAAEVSLDTQAVDPNAFADIQDNVHMNGGLVAISGSDAEIAAILAHEFAHVMYGHVEIKINNALVGMLVGGGIGMAVASGGAGYNQQFGEDMMRVGYNVGANAYSPEMEIEADRTAVYILQNAGYPTTAMRDTIVRMSRADNLAQQQGPATRRVGFLQTHPSSGRRVAHILSAIEDVESGARLVMKAQ